MATQFSRYGRRGRLDLQSADATQVDPPVDPDAGLGDTADSPETDLIEVVAEDVAQQQESDRVDQAVADIDTLDDFANQLEEGGENGGVAPGVATAINTGLESIDRRYNFRKLRKLGIEDFSDRNMRPHANRLAVESVKERAVQLRDWVVKQFNEMVEWVVAQWNKYFDINTKLNERVKKVTESLGDKKFDGGKEIESAKVAAALQIGGSTDGFNASVAEEQSKLVQEGLDASKRVIDVVSKITEDTFASGENRGKFMEQLQGAAETEGFKDLSAEEAKKLGGENFTAGSGTDELPGGFKIYTVVNDDKDVSVGIGKVSEFDGTKIKTLSSADAGSILKSLGALTANLLAGKPLVKELQAGAKKVSDTMVRSAEKSGQFEGAEGKERLKIVTKVATVLRKLTPEPFNTLVKYETGFVKAALDLVELSIKEGAGAAPAGEGEKK